MRGGQGADRSSVGNPHAPRRLLVVGVIHGDEAAGLPIATALSDLPVGNGKGQSGARRAQPQARRGFHATPGRTPAGWTSSATSLPLGGHRPSRRPAALQHHIAVRTRVSGHVSAHCRLPTHHHRLVSPVRPCGGRVRRVSRCRATVCRSPGRTAASPSSLPRQRHELQNLLLPHSSAFVV